MRGGFRQLAHPATRVSDVDLETTRPEREALHAQLRLRAHLLHLLATSSPDSDGVVVESLPTVETSEAA
jgi:hypothetical protein